MTDTNRAKAIAALPEGFFLVDEGAVAEGDLVWDFRDDRWTPVTAPLLPDAGRVERLQGKPDPSEVGHDVSLFVAVVRKTGQAAML